jgi:splicing factor U2AF subunit
VYARYRNEDDAQKAVTSMNDRFYAGRPLWASLSPVTDFRECKYFAIERLCNWVACCRQYDIGECARAGFCNFMHLRRPTSQLVHELVEGQKLSVKLLKKDRKKSRSRDRRSRSRERRRSRSRDRDRRRY